MLPSSRLKDEFVRHVTDERESRAALKVHNSAALKIQRFMRNVTGKKRLLQRFRMEVDATLKECKQSLLPATDMFFAGQKLLFVYNEKKDKKRFVSFCEVVLAGMEADEVKVWYVTLALNKKHAVPWIKQIKQLLTMACNGVKFVKLGYPEDDLSTKCLLSMMVTFCDYTLWKFTAKAGDAIKPILHQLCVTFVDHVLEDDFYPTMNELLIGGLCCTEPKLSGQSLPAAMGIRLLALHCFSSPTMILFIRHVLTVPASMLHLQHLSPETMHQLHKVNFLDRVIEVLSNLKSSLTGLESNAVLSITCNILYLGSLEVNDILDVQKKRGFLGVLLELLPGCENRRMEMQCNASFWHPLLGWCKGKMDSRIFESFTHVRKQLQCLWQPYFVDGLFSQLLSLKFDEISRKEKSKVWNFKGNQQHLLSQSCINEVGLVCEVYLQFLSAMSQLSLDILMGLGCNQPVIYQMWCFLREKSRLQVKMIIGGEPILALVLSLFCQMMLYLLLILDDHELFEEQKIFKLSDFAEISKFLNQLLFHILWEEIDYPSSGYCQSLLSMLYRRDSKCHFCGEDVWLIKDFKVNVFMGELKSKKSRSICVLSKLPQIIPHRKRVEIFHQRVKEEKASLGITRHTTPNDPATYITIHRERILEDGYQQLCLLSTPSLKRTIRVKFINMQGLDEAGIDEAGVFKEFLEEALKMAFDPGLNLFKSNTQGHLFPSSSSHIQDNHLALFEFVGRMLGKALYEGIVVDIPFAPFFLSHILEHNHSSYYNYLDELASFDQQMYTSLNFIKILCTNNRATTVLHAFREVVDQFGYPQRVKYDQGGENPEVRQHYDGSMEDLCLTFSWDEDFMGKTVTHELVPGGCGIPVTTTNRFNYVHRMALFRMSTQIKKQTDAFIKGFNFLIDPSLIQCFSAQELQKLISGDQADIDVEDLRKHTVYLGGYHNHHRVMTWLWDILKNDCTSVERGQFLKFVTSCSRPPLLGFEHLHPPFTVRCVQVSYDEDTGDSLSGMIRGFFSLKHHSSKERLPSASTCFNLLKLPNYPKKSVLKQKLKYAIQANSGFELS